MAQEEINAPVLERGEHAFGPLAIRHEGEDRREGDRVGRTLGGGNPILPPQLVGQGPQLGQIAGIGAELHLPGSMSGQDLVQLEIGLLIPELRDSRRQIDRLAVVHPHAIGQMIQRLNGHRASGHRLNVEAQRLTHPIEREASGRLPKSLLARLRLQGIVGLRAATLSEGERQSGFGPLHELLHRGRGQGAGAGAEAFDPQHETAFAHAAYDLKYPGNEGLRRSRLKLRERFQNARRELQEVIHGGIVLQGDAPGQIRPSSERLRPRHGEDARGHMKVVQGDTATAFQESVGVIEHLEVIFEAMSPRHAGEGQQKFRRQSSGLLREESGQRERPLQQPTRGCIREIASVRSRRMPMAKARDHLRRARQELRALRRAAASDLPGDGVHARSQLLIFDRARQLGRSPEAVQGHRAGDQ
ncbi:hypothetical protein HRbin08_01451 [bacterium HR08]|nr:hypothetical protein HRbin08_01451 [bacterium HR08]